MQSDSDFSKYEMKEGDLEKCVLSPCGCSTFTNFLIETYGKKGYNHQMNNVRDMCASLCTNGVFTPSNSGIAFSVDAANKAMSDQQAQLLRGMKSGVEKTIKDVQKEIKKKNDTSISISNEELSFTTNSEIDIIEQAFQQELEEVEKMF